MPSDGAAATAAGSIVRRRTWKRARRRWPAVSHQRSSAGQGPAQPVTGVPWPPSTDSCTGAAVTSPRPVARIGSPAGPTTSGARTGTNTVAGGALLRPDRQDEATQKAGSRAGGRR